MSYKRKSFAVLIACLNNKTAKETKHGKKHKVSWRKKTHHVGVKSRPFAPSYRIGCGFIYLRNNDLPTGRLGDYILCLPWFLPGVLTECMIL